MLCSSAEMQLYKRCCRAVLQYNRAICWSKLSQQASASAGWALFHISTERERKYKVTEDRATYLQIQYSRIKAATSAACTRSRSALCPYFTVGQWCAAGHHHMRT